MNQFGQVVNTFDSKLQYVIDNYIQKPTLIRGVVYLCLMLYAARIAPVPPMPVLRLFENVYFKLFIFSLILWTAQVSPSTSILIAVAFMVTINYTTTGKLWEMMDNIVPSAPSAPSAPSVPSVPVKAAPAQSVDAIKALAQAAALPTAAPVDAVTSVANVAAVNVTTPEGLNAVQQLAQQAITPVAGSPDKIQAAVQAAVSSIPVPVQEQVAVPVTTEQSVTAIKALADAAVAPTAAPVDAVTSVANIAAANVSTQVGLDSLQKLAEQAATPAAGEPEKVKVAAETAIKGCYPLRNYDMSKVSGSVDGQGSFEDYEKFVASQ